MVSSPCEGTSIAFTVEERDTGRKVLQTIAQNGQRDMHCGDSSSGSSAWDQSRRRKQPAAPPDVRFASNSVRISAAEGIDAKSRSGHRNVGEVHDISVRKTYTDGVLRMRPTGYAGAQCPAMRAHFGTAPPSGASNDQQFELPPLLHAPSRLPVFRCTVVTMCPSLPLAVLPGIVTEFRRVF